MLPAAEADFEPELVDLAGELCDRFRRPVEIEAQAGQGFVEQLVLTRPQRMAFDPAVETV